MNLPFLIALTAIAAEGNRFSLGWELPLMEWLQANLSEGAINVISNLSMFGEELLLVVIMGFFYWCWDKELGKRIGLTFLVVSVWNPMIKNLVLRLRPYFCSDRVDLLRLIDTSADKYDVAAQGYSFPSGHSAGAVSIYGSAARGLRKKWAVALAFLLPLLVGFSRVVVGAHFPTDVLAGWALGALAVFLIPWLQKTIKNRWILYGLLVLIALPGFLYCTSTDYYSSFGMLLGFVFAEPFEDKFVRFENTRNPIRIILRILGGGAVYFGLNTVIKMLLPAALKASEGLAANLARCGRYAVVIFVVLAIYPMLFKLTAKIGRKSA